VDAELLGANVMKLVQVSYAALLIAVGQLLVATGQGNWAAAAAAVTAVIVAFLPTVLPVGQQ